MASRLSRNAVIACDPDGSVMRADSEVRSGTSLKLVISTNTSFGELFRSPELQIFAVNLLGSACTGWRSWCTSKSASQRRELSHGENSGSGGVRVGHPQRCQPGAWRALKRGVEPLA